LSTADPSTLHEERTILGQLEGVLRNENTSALERPLMTFDVVLKEMAWLQVIYVEGVNRRNRSVIIQLRNMMQPLIQRDRVRQSWRGMRKDGKV
jgi:hypothetical protein